MSISFDQVAQTLRVWRSRLRVELQELVADIRRVVALNWEELRQDHVRRSYLLQELLRGVLTAFHAGPRATALWVLVVALEAILAVVRVVQGLGEHGYAVAN